MNIVVLIHNVQLLKTLDTECNTEHFSVKIGNIETIVQNFQQ